MCIEWDRARSGEVPTSVAKNYDKRIEINRYPIIRYPILIYFNSLIIIYIRLYTLTKNLYYIIDSSSNYSFRD